MHHVRLGVNIDHVATVRNARGGLHPDPVRAALIAQNAGADGITAHLREDRRHISDKDIENLMQKVELPLNLEMAATEEMLAIALRHKPHAICLVPEKREERTTEGGLDVAGNLDYLTEFTKKLSDSGSRISFFIEPEIKQIDAVLSLKAPVIEFHTGAYCEAYYMKNTKHIEAQMHRLHTACLYATGHHIEIHAGHGITFDTVPELARLPNVKELNIGHFIIGEALFAGLENAILKMRDLMNRAMTTHG